MSPFYRALISILPAWRALASHDLPLWSFIKRRNLHPARGEALRGEFRCAMCDWQAQCKALIARGRTKPGFRCPNAQLLRR